MKSYLQSEENVLNLDFAEGYATWYILKNFEFEIWNEQFHGMQIKSHNVNKETESKYYKMFFIW